LRLALSSGMQKRLLHHLLLLLTLIFGLEVSARTGDAPAVIQQSTGICDDQLLDSIVIQPFEQVGVVQISVFNCEVDQFHSYFVLPPGKESKEEAVWVHNHPDGTLYRGGNSTELSPRDVLPGPDGLIHPINPKGEPQGLSINLNPNDYWVQRKGGAFPVEYIPEGLQVIPWGQPGHYLVCPAYPMSKEVYQSLLNQIELAMQNVINAGPRGGGPRVRSGNVL
jgi:hypothetical protein